MRENLELLPDVEQYVCGLRDGKALGEQLLEHLEADAEQCPFYASGAVNGLCMSERYRDRAWYQGVLYLQYADGVPYRLKAPFDFGFIKKYGKVFKVYDDQDSGNICFGLERDGKRVFLKFAGAPTARFAGNSGDAVEKLAASAQIYRDLAHGSLIRLIESGEMGGGYGVVFEWTDAVSMARMYPDQHRIFTALPAEDKLAVFRDTLRFHSFAAERGYVAVDFYDGTVMYDVENRRTVLCDIDFYRKAPAKNDMGRMWGSLKFMSPEELTLGAVLDETTNVYAMGALAFALFAEYSRERADWTLSDALYAAAKKAASDSREARYPTIKALLADWENILENERRN